MEANRLRQLTRLPAPPSAPSSPLPVSLVAPRNSSHKASSGQFSTMASDSVHCRARPDVRKPRWDAAGTERSKFYPYSDLYDDEADEEDDGGGLFGFGGSKKERKWWSDDADDEEDEEEEEFWGLKILRAFGWMVPAILISMLLENGPNALFMAVALPLGQTALSLAVDKIWGMARQTTRPRPRNRTGGKYYASTSSRNHARKRNENADFASSKEARSSPSSTGFYQPAQENGNGASTSFGGWDELDSDVEMKPKKNEQKRQKMNSKVSKRIRNRDSPLFIRLLVAVFPFLGSWARFL